MCTIVAPHSKSSALDRNLSVTYRVGESYCVLSRIAVSGRPVQTLYGEINI